MKKDFSQEFERTPTLAFLIIESSDGRFVLFADPDDIEEYGEVDAMKTLHMELNGDNSVAMQGR